MRIAIPSLEKNENSQIDVRFGRAVNFYICDLDNNESYFVDNKDNSNLGHGAGMQTAQLVLEQKIDAVISGQVGPKAYNILKKANIKIYVVNSNINIQEAIELFKNNKLEMQN